jgi:hypothetical protein
LTIDTDTDFPVDSPRPPSAPRNRPSLFDDDDDEVPQDYIIEVIEEPLPPPILRSPQQGEQRSGRPKCVTKKPDNLTYEELGQPRIRYYSQPSARYGYSNLAFFGSVLSTLSMPRLPSWSCPNIIAAMNVKWRNRSQDPIDKRFEDLLEVSTHPLA